ncbi:MAG: 50S ribosomal protein L10 [Anaerolineales bacterium]|nr:50S ribosomal protein L10 [Anaerolineales bacterium]
MALSKQKKNEVLDQYKDWLKNSQAVILVEYTGATMKVMENIRAKVRESGGEFHVVKNTLVKRALESSGYVIPEGLLENSSAASFAFSDPVGTAKALAEATKGMEAIKVKGGYMGTELLGVAQVKALADLPPLPVVRGQLLGVLQAPAGKLVRTIAEPARSLASVFRAYSEKAQAAA